MKVTSLLYHDVVANGNPDKSGLPGSGAAVYKLSDTAFQSHLAALAESSLRVQTISDALEQPSTATLVLTFDDGGNSAYTHIAPLLESNDWIGHFFITAGYVGSPGFVTPEEIRNLAERGHVIGSHSWSHPARMSALTDGRLSEEWLRSTELLSSIIGQAITTASVPGGFYSDRVASAAAVAGIRYLFTSEPMTICRNVEGCTVLGRYTIWNHMPADSAVALALGSGAARQQQWLWWNTKKLLKTAGGTAWLRFREAYLETRKQSPCS